MQKQKYILLAMGLAFLTAYDTIAQTSYDDLPTVSVGIGYFGELATHPGLVVFGEMALNEGKNQLATRLNLVYFRHRGHTKNYLLLPELVARRNTKRFNYWETSIGLGTLYQTADSPVYEFQQGNFAKRKFGWFYFTPSLGIRHGRTLILNNEHLLAPSVGGRFFYQYPFNDFWLPRAAFDISVSYQLK